MILLVKMVVIKTVILCKKKKKESVTIDFIGRLETHKDTGRIQPRLLPEI